LSLATKEKHGLSLTRSLLSKIIVLPGEKFVTLSASSSRPKLQKEGREREREREREMKSSGSGSQVGWLMMQPTIITRFGDLLHGINQTNLAITILAK
jgi:hypothetical protein